MALTKILYKFEDWENFEEIPLEEDQILSGDVKRQIAGSLNLNNPTLKITDLRTREVYEDDGFIPSSAVLLVELVWEYDGVLAIPSVPLHTSTPPEPDHLDIVDPKYEPPLTREEEESRIIDYVEKTARDYQDQLTAAKEMIKAEINKKPRHCRRCPVEAPRHLVQDCQEELRPGYICNKCSQPGHHIKNCTVPNLGYVCRMCGERDHYFDDCPRKLEIIIKNPETSSVQNH